ncbi:pre-mRNA-processing factor 19-like isoform X2 [Hylaeus volcanicus]|uniref:pre-mRNA-processing factor 19-like isoform X2 n=1 Tax=Hylaeus volcanicus TaxID=313075 RepID=UPI0023B80422|nr:pre-mRNA-processing factor 19-like isoform X2 [Hylaeus volcanicus]
MGFFTNRSVQFASAFRHTRLLREKEAAEKVTTQLQRETKTFTEAQAQGLSVVQEVGVSEGLLEELQSHAKMLLGKRKKRDLSNLPSKNIVSSMREIASFTPHSSTLPGITRCLVHPLSKVDDTTKCVWTAGIDGAVHLFDVQNEKTLCRLHGHLKRVNSVACSGYRSDIVVTASDDKTVRVWSSSDNDLESYKLSYLLRHHTKGVTNVCINPMANLFISTSRDLSWILHDLNSGQVLRAYRDLPCAMPVLMFHPDGMLIGASGMNNNIYIYDVKGDCSPTIILPGHETPVTDLQFSENGYYLATASACPGGTVKLWDLRKSFNFETIQPVNEENIPFSPSKICFDDSGNYLAVTGGTTDANDSTHYSAGCASIYSFVSKTQLELIKSLQSHTNLVTDASFGRNAQSLFTCSLDRTVKYWHVNNEQETTT